MAKTIQLTEDVPVREGCYDVVVAGGGLAGVAAALAAKRAGRKTLLLEKTNLLGGLGTIGLINLFVPMCNGRGRQIIRGMAEEFLRLSVRNGFDTLPDAWRNGEPATPTLDRYVTRYSAQIFALELLNLVVGEGVDLLLDCVAAHPVMKDGRCEGLVTESKSGREFIGAKIVVDATGDADVLYRAGAPTVQGRNYFTYIAFAANLESCRKAGESGMIRDMYATRYFPGPADLYGRKHPEGMRHFLGTNVDDVTDYLVTSQRKLLEMISSEPADSRNRREIPTLPTMPQFRTTRRLDGDYTVREEDAYRHFDDSVGAICDFDRRDYLYEIPWRAMTKRGFDNLIAVGRVVSGDGYGWDVIRVIPPAILTGEVAGIAAALALETGRAVPDVDIRELQRRIAAAGNMIHFDDAWIPTEEEEGAPEADIGHI